MIEIRYRGALGNRLFQYALGRHLAETHGLEFRAPVRSPFPITRETLPGTRNPGPRLRLTDASLRLDPFPAHRRIQLYGFFQDMSWLHGVPLNKWYALPPALETDPRDAVVHVRLGDFVKLNRVLPVTYYCEAIRRLNPRRLFLCTDRPRSPFLNPLMEFRPEIIRANPSETMAAIASFSRVILSQSTFSWWAAYLGKAREIIYPAIHTHPDQENWPRRQLLPIEDERYIVMTEADLPTVP